MNVSAVLRELMAAGLAGEALIAAVERIEDADESAKQATRAARNRRYQDKLKSRKAEETEEAEAQGKTPKTSKTSQPSYGVSPKTKVPPDPPINSTPIPEGKGVPEAKSERGHRLPTDFRLSDADRAFAAGEGWTPEQIIGAEAEFVDHWSNEPGAKGRKLDWSKTWRNRVRRFPPPGARRAPRYPPRAEKSGVTDLLRDIEDRIRERDNPQDARQRRAGPGAWPDDRSLDGRDGMGGAGPILDLEPVRPDRE